jgi:hypothetical protein
MSHRELQPFSTLLQSILKAPHIKAAAAAGMAAANATGGSLQVARLPLVN